MPRKTPATEPGKRQWITPNEAHALFAVSPRTIKRAIAAEQANPGTGLPMDIWTFWGNDLRLNREALHQHLTRTERISLAADDAA